MLSAKLLATPVDRMILIIVLGGILGAVYAWIEFRKNGGFGKGTATALLVTSLLLIATNLLEKFFDIQERKRPPITIERIRTSVEVRIDSEQEEFAQLGRLLENSAADCLVQAAELPGSDEAYLVEQGCVPDFHTDPFISSALGSLIVRIGIYKATNFSESEGPEPDLAGLFAASVSDETLQIVYDRETRAFILHVPGVEKELSTLNPSGEITTSDDLAGARLQVSLDNFHVDTRTSSILYSAMQLERLELRLAGNRTRYLVLGADELIEVRKDTNPVYVYRIGEPRSKP